MKKFPLFLLFAMISIVAYADKYYIKGSFNNWTSPVELSTYDATNGKSKVEYLDISSGGDWSKVIFYSTDDSGNVLKYYGSDTNASLGNDIDTAITAYDPADDIESTKYLTTDFTTDNVYEIILKVADGIVWSEATQKPTTYYFYGDLNLWSIRNVSGQHDCDAVAEDANAKDISDLVWAHGQQRPQKYSQAALDSDWAFKQCDADHPYPQVDGVATPSNDAWYYFDLKGVEDFEGIHSGRLCGQFKITAGDWGYWNWGPKRVNGVDYLKNKIKVGEVYGEDVDRQGVNGFTRSNGLQNFQLDCSYVDNAVIYFNPSDMQLVITGDPKYIYVYYTQRDNDDFSAPSRYTMTDFSQKNYYVNSNGFTSGSGGNAENDTYNPVDADGIRQYRWEELTGDDAIGPDGTQYAKAYRRLIPYGAIHRFAVPFYVTVSNSKGSYFKQRNVKCEDIWFVESKVNLYFRYADDRPLSWVGYNIFTGRLDDNGYPDGYDFAYGSSLTGSSTAVSNGTWVRAVPTEYDGHTWFKSSEEVPTIYVGGWAMFTTSQGLSYPAGLTGAVAEDLQPVYIDGDGDLFYVVNEGYTNPELLYSHLKGSYDPSQSDLQIQAELLDEDGNLDTSLNSTRYRFEVYDGDRQLQLDVDQDQIVDEDSGFDGFQKQPFCTIVDSSCQLTEPCYLQVIVKAKKNGKIYVASDTYPVFIK